MSEAEVVVERHEGVAVLRLRAEDRRNALTVEMAQAMIDACEALDADASVGAVVVTGGSYFCAGGARDVLKAAGEDPAQREAYANLGTVYRAFERVGQLESPTIAAVRGGAVGAGINLAFATDLRVVAQDAKLISGFIPIGLHPGGGHGVLLGRTGQREATSAMMLFGERITGAQAVELGFAWAAVPDEEVEARAVELAAVPAKDPELARRTAKTLRMELGPPGLPWGAALDLERASQMWTLRRWADA
jgi:enoyl-CoA hydratase